MTPLSSFVFPQHTFEKYQASQTKKIFLLENLSVLFRPKFAQLVHGLIFKESPVLLKFRTEMELPLKKGFQLSATRLDGEMSALLTSTLFFYLYPLGQTKSNLLCPERA